MCRVRLRMLLLLLCGLLALVAIVRVFSDSRKNLPPGPFNFPFLGSLQQTKLVNTLLHEEIRKFASQYGNIIFLRLVLDEPVVIVRGYDLIKEATQSRAFSGVGRPITFQEHGLYRRLGLIFSDGENWHQMRRFSLRALHDQGFGRKTRSANINEEAAEVLEPLLAAAAEGSEVSAKGLFTLASVNSLAHLVVGKKLERGTHARHLAELTDRNAAWLGSPSMHLEVFPWLRHVAPELSGFRQFQDDVQELINVFKPQIEEHRAAVDNAGDDEPAGDVLEAFLQHQKEDQHRVFTDDNLRVLLKDLVMAGFETVNSSMEWVLLHLMEYPEVQERVFAEIDEVVGRDRTPTIDDIPAMPYLEAVLEETIRFSPAIPVIQHCTSFGRAQLGGYHVPHNSRVIYDLHSVMHEADFWGDPERFRPERFLGPDGARLRERVFAFGYGLRRCIGETHARQAMFLFTAGLLQRLRLSLTPGQSDLHRLKPGLVLKPRPFTFKVELRN